MRFFNQKFLRIASLTVLVFLANCSKEEKTDSTSVEPKFSSLYKNVFSDCASCHATGKEAFSQLPDLEFSTTEAAYASLRKNSSKMGCENFKNINPGNPNASVAFVILSNELKDSFLEANGSDCGITPPLDHGIQEHSADTISVVRTWITNGARND